MDRRSLWPTYFEGVALVAGLMGLVYGIVNVQYATIMMAVLALVSVVLLIGIRNDRDELRQELE